MWSPKTSSWMTSVAKGRYRHGKAGPLASFFVVLVLLAMAGCSQREQALPFAGQTMGTSYHVTLIPEGRSVPKDLSLQIQAVLDDVDRKMSTYKPDSELNRLNRQPVGEPMAISPELMDVLVIARQIYGLSDGAFDPTVGPLVDLWGFGPSFHQDQVPDPERIASLLEQVGFDGLAIDEEELIATRLRPVSLDLSAVAKGYAADRVGELLQSAGLTRYMVEVGGEMALSGNNADGVPWRIAVERPQVQARDVQQVISVRDVGVATSGDYRNYFEKDGKRYSHTIDPRTGYPITHNLASVTVVTGKSGRADALATAFMVMGEEATLRFARAQDIAVLTLSKRGEEFVASHSPAFEPYIGEQN